MPWHLSSHGACQPHSLLRDDGRRRALRSYCAHFQQNSNFLTRQLWIFGSNESSGHGFDSRLADSALPMVKWHHTSLPRVFFCAD
jgi:hypothetical protein